MPLTSNPDCAGIRKNHENKMVYLLSSVIRKVKINSLRPFHGKLFNVNRRENADN